MARRKRKNNNLVLQMLVCAIALGILIFVGNHYSIDILNSFETNSLEQVENTQSNSVEGNLVVDFIDVGQGDSILIRQGEYTMIIDGGTSECKDELLQFLKDENVDRFEYIIGTHAHEDHIGSLDDVVNAYDFDTFLFPKSTTTTKTFENLVTAVKNKGKKFTTPKTGQEYELGEATITVIAPNNEKYSSQNNYSIVVRVEFGGTSFLFTGDAETLSEKEILSNGLNIDSDVLKLGHHGSNTSSSEEFLSAVTPEYAIVSAGIGNSYNHPNKKTMDNMKKLDVPVYRTDEQGTIEAVSDGKNITFNTEPGTYKYPND